MRTLLFIFILIYSSISNAFTISEHYRPGIEICESNKSKRKGEIEKWVEVPVDYSNPQGEKTLIYAYTKKEFNKNKPSLIFFTGGPGASSRSTEFDLPNTNLIYFEQRGISCSRPATKELFLDPKFYSSENTAKDALAVTKSYELNSVVAYGQSYGTIPATIFASSFPQSVKSLIIEGVMYQADKSLWNSEIKKNLLQGFFNQLPKAKQERILSLSKENILPANWFSKLGGMMLYLNDGIDIFNIFLDNVLAMETESLKTFILSFYPVEKPEEEFSYGDVMMGMIGCQEISMAQSGLSMTLVFDGKELVYDEDNIYRLHNCRPLNLENHNSGHYEAVNYPVNVPVFYLLGENDGATDLDQGMAHFNNVAQGEKTLLVMSKGGHLPSLSLLKDNRACDPETHKDQCASLKQNNLMLQIFEGIISTTQVDTELVSEFNKVGPLFWSY